MPAENYVILLFWAITALITYWIIRLAVRHALRDADARRASEASGRSASVD
jgi:hypothetical protein